MSNTIDGVSVTKAANVYFDGKCISHNLALADGSRKSVGVVLPASLTFNTGEREIMEGAGGSCRIRLKGASEWKCYGAGESFEVPANWSFDIVVEGEPFHYVCHYG